MIIYGIKQRYTFNEILLNISDAFYVIFFVELKKGTLKKKKYIYIYIYRNKLIIMKIFFHIKSDLILAYRMAWFSFMAYQPL